MTGFESFVATGFAWRSRQVHRIIRSAFDLLLGAALLFASFTVGSTSALAQFSKRLLR